jgi:hypothetical protein
MAAECSALNPPVGDPVAPRQSSIANLSVSRII